MNKNILLFFLSFFTLLSCKQEKQAPAREHRSHVSFYVVEAFQEPLFFEAIGTLSAQKEMKLSFKTGGIIRKMLVSEGASVKKGKVLAILDLSEINAEKTKAELAFEKAKRDLIRAKSLYEDSVATLETYQNAETALKIAQSQKEIADFNYNHSIIKAPADGKILKKIAEANEVIAPGYPVFLFASTESEWVLKSNITDKDVVKIMVGDSASVHFDAYPNRRFDGQIAEISNAADPFTGTYQVKVAIKNDAYRLLSGMFGVAKIFFNQKNDIFKIPVSYIFDADESHAFVYKMKNAKVYKTKLRLNSFYEGHILSDSGIAAGDTIIMSNNSNIEEGSVVRLKISTKP